MSEKTNEHQGIHARVTPQGSMDILSRHEVNLLKDKNNQHLHDIFVDVLWPFLTVACSPMIVKAYWMRMLILISALSNNQEVSSWRSKMRPKAHLSMEK